MVKTVAAVAAALFASAQGTFVTFAKLQRYFTSSCSGDNFFEDYMPLESCSTLDRAYSEDGNNFTWLSTKNTCVNGVYTVLSYVGSQTCSGTPSFTEAVNTECTHLGMSAYRKVSCPDASHPDHVQSQDFAIGYTDASCNTPGYGLGPFFAYPCANQGTSQSARSEAAIKANGKITLTTYNSSDCTGTVVGNITEIPCGTCVARRGTGTIYHCADGTEGADSAWAQAPGGLIAGWVLATVVRAMAV